MNSMNLSGDAIEHAFIVNALAGGDGVTSKTADEAFEEIFGDVPDAKDYIAAKEEPAFKLTAGQQKALDDIMASLSGRTFMAGGEHSLQGYAGTGKTTLMRFVISAMIKAKLRVVATAPTNKAVAVLERNLRDTDAAVPTATIYSLLGLTPGSDDEKRKPKRVGKNKSKGYDVVIIDECSMVGSDLMEWIRKDLRSHFVLYIGDPAQLPPVGETLSKTFLCERKSILTEIMRQAADNPIIALATDIRAMIKFGRPDWQRFSASDAGGPAGIFTPHADAAQWIEDAFTSPEFAADNDRYRYLCWTNARVQFINANVRKLIYGETETPFVPDERVLVRSSITGESGDVVINTNDEATIVHIEPGLYEKEFSYLAGGYNSAKRPVDEIQARTVRLDVWNVRLRNRHGDVVDTRFARDQEQYKDVCGELVAEARRNGKRWYEYFDFTDDVAKLQSVYAMTVHCSQGSTFENVFLDMDDCARNSKTEEMLKLLYVGATRPQKALVLV